MLAAALVAAALAGPVQAAGERLERWRENREERLQDREDRTTLRERIEERRSEESAAPAGAVRQTLTVGGQAREFLVFEASPGKDPALIIVMHGGGGGSDRLAKITQMHEGARNAVVFYPNSSGHWNDGRSNTARYADDIAFFDAMVAHARKSYGVAPGKIFVSGISNGGLMTLRIACERAGSVRAVATVVASFPSEYISRCRPSGPVPILMINGTKDSMVRWTGGEIPTSRSGDMGAGGPVVPPPQTFDFWVRQDGCNPEPSSKALPDVNGRDGSTVTRLRWSGCRGGAEVVVLRIDGGEHGWAGSPRFIPGRNPGQDISATAEILSFFRAHGL